MIDAKTELQEQAELAAAQRQHRQERRTAAAVVGLAVLLTAGPVWLAFILGLSVRAFTAAAGWGG